jgi:hypothetical protein
MTELERALLTHTRCTTNRTRLRFSKGTSHPVHRRRNGSIERHFFHYPLAAWNLPAHQKEIHTFSLQCFTRKQIAQLLLSSRKKPYPYVNEECPKYVVFWCSVCLILYCFIYLVENKINKITFYRIQFEMTII